MDGAIAAGAIAVGDIGDGVAAGDGAAAFTGSVGRITMAITAIIRVIITPATITAAIMVARITTAIAAGITVAGAIAIGVTRAGDIADTGATVATGVVATDKR